MANQNSITKNAYLTNFMLEYRFGDEFIGQRIMPRLNVPSLVGFYYEVDRSAQRVVENLRARYAGTKIVTEDLSEIPFGPLNDRGLQMMIDYKDILVYGTKEKAKVAKTKLLARLMDLKLEKLIVDKVLSTSVITQNATISGTGRFNNGTTSDPFGYFRTAIGTIEDATGQTPNIMATSIDVYRVLETHPQFIAMLGLAKDKVLSRQQLATLIGVDEILVSKVQYNSAKEGQTRSQSKMWGKDILFAYVENNTQPNIENPSLGYTLTWEGANYMDEYSTNDPVADWVRANDFYDVFTVDTAAGYLLKTVID